MDSWDIEEEAPVEAISGTDEDLSIYMKAKKDQPRKLHPSERSHLAAKRGARNLEHPSPFLLPREKTYGYQAPPTKAPPPSQLTQLHHYHQQRLPVVHKHHAEISKKMERGWDANLNQPADKHAGGVLMKYDAAEDRHLKNYHMALRQRRNQNLPEFQEIESSASLPHKQHAAFHDSTKGAAGMKQKRMQVALAKQQMYTRRAAAPSWASKSRAHASETSLQNVPPLPRQNSSGAYVFSTDAFSPARSSPRSAFASPRDSNPVSARSTGREEDAGGEQTGGERVMATIKTLTMEIKSHMHHISDERAAKLKTMKKLKEIKQKHTTVTKQVEKLREKVGMGEGAAQRCVVIDTERSKAVAAARHREMQNRELKQMLDMTQRRLRELDGGSPRKVGGNADAGRTRQRLRDQNKAKVTLQKKVDALLTEKEELTVAVEKKALLLSDTKHRQAAAVERHDSSKRAALQEREAQLQVEMEREVAKTREANAKAARHRIRELEERERAAQLVIDDLRKKLEKAGGTVTKTKEADGAKSSALLLEKQAEELVQQRLAEENAVASLEKRKEAALVSLGSLEKQLAEARRDQDAEMADEEMKRQGAQADRKAQKERDLAVVQDLEEQQRVKLAKIGELEEQLGQRSEARSQAGVQSSEVNVLREEVASIEAALGTQRRDLTELNAEVEKQRAAADTSDKDRIIERLTSQSMTLEKRFKETSELNTSLLSRLNAATVLLQERGVEM